MKHRGLLAIVVISTLVTLSCGPCGAISELAGEEGPEISLPPIELDDETPVTPPDDTGAPVEEPVEEPMEEDVPAGPAWSDIPIYPGAREIDEGLPFPSPGAPTDYEGAEIRTYETSDATQKVADFYLTEMANNGWEKIMDMPVEGNHVSAWINESKNVGATIMVIEGQDGMTQIMIVVGQEE